MKASDIRSCLFAAVLIATIAPTAKAVTISCGQSLDTGGGTVVVDNDLSCGSGSRILTVSGGGTVDFNGHTLTCTSGTIDGIFVASEKMEIINGTVDGCDYGMWVNRMKVEVRNMVFKNNTTWGFYASVADGLKLSNCLAEANGDDGFEINSPKTKIERNTATDNGGAGFFVASFGHGAKFKENHAFNNSGDGFEVDGAEKVSFKGDVSINNTRGFDLDSEGGKVSKTVAIDNAADHYQLDGNRMKISKCRAIAGSSAGFDVNGDGIGVSGNEALDVGGSGFLVGGNDNKLKKNSAYSSGSTDIADTSSCTNGNQYKGNLFGTSSGACVE